jgi:CHAT domain-containing protein/Tfp pilus assembly protein PilF
VQRRTNRLHFSILLIVASLVATPTLAQESRWKELDAQIDELQKQGKNNEALPLAAEALHIAEETFGAENPNTATALKKLGGTYYALGKYDEAEPLYKRALAIREKSLGPDHPDVAKSLNNLANLYSAQGKYAEGEPLYKRALAIREKALGSDHPDVAQSLNNLANLYYAQGKYAEAEPLHKRALAIREKVLGPDHPDVATSLNNLAKLYEDQGKYAEGEPLYKRALAIWEKSLGPDDPDVAFSLNNLANLYVDQGKYSEAEPLYKRALAIREKSLGPDHPDVATSLNNLADMYAEQEKYAEAEPLDKRALAIFEKALGPDHPDVAASLSTLAMVYADQGKYAEAEVLHKRALAIFEKALGPDHPIVAASLTALAMVYADQGKYAEAEPLYERALAIREKALGPDHQYVAQSLNNLALLYWALGKNGEAGSFFERNLQNLSKRFEYSFTYMSEKDRLEFLEQAQVTFPAYFSFCLAYHENDPALVGAMYDVLLWEKGLVGSSIAALRARVASTGDAQAVKLFEELTAKKSESARLVTTQPPDWQEARMRVDTEANDLEQQLTRRVSSLAEQKYLARTTWRDIQKALKPDEAAIEFVRFPYHDGKKQTGKTYYVALVVRPESPRPVLIQLGDTHELEGKSFSAYRAEVGSRGARAADIEAQAATSPWRSLHDAVWKPLEPALAGAKRVYISPDGPLNEIPLGILQGTDGLRVMEKYDVRIVSSTRDLLRPIHPPTSNTAILVGNPRFLLTDEEQRTAVNQLRSSENPEQSILLTSASLPSNPASGTLSRDAIERGVCDPLPPAGGVLCPLPGTAAEAQSIGELLREKDWHVSSYQGEQALEEVVKRVTRPRLLHMATHGFFESDQQVKLGDSLGVTPSGFEDPMLRSGLFFAGADRILNGKPPIEGIENGVLTAYEATALNLQGTELVVLSACETGRGQVQNGEGVFGLRRALQEAGSESVLMSLWSVPDRETQELMTLFYKNWLDGMDKPEALRSAQIKERDQVEKRYGKDLPYYWGAFILVGR